MRICVDLDGTLCRTTGEDYLGARPLRSRIAEVNDLYRAGHRIIVSTARGSGSGEDWREKTARQLSEWGLLYHELDVGRKVPADVYVDDRAVHADRFFAGAREVAGWRS